jgi:hypothetical protein
MLLTVRMNELEDELLRMNLLDWAAVSAPKARNNQPRQNAVTVTHPEQVRKQNWQM